MNIWKQARQCSFIRQHSRRVTALPRRKGRRRLRPKPDPPARTPIEAFHFKPPQETATVLASDKAAIVYSTRTARASSTWPHVYSLLPGVQINWASIFQRGDAILNFGKNAEILLRQSDDSTTALPNSDLASVTKLIPELNGE